MSLLAEKLRAVLLDNTSELSFSTASTTSADFTSLALTFTNDCPSNTTILSDAGPAYSVSTPLGTLKTEIRRFTPGADCEKGALVASTETRLFLPDVMTHPGRFGSKRVKLSRFLHCIKTKAKDGLFSKIKKGTNSTNRDRRPISFMDTTFGRCVWMSDSSHRLMLFLESEMDKPLASLFSATDASPLMLMVDYRALPVQDDIVIGAVILEQKLRIRAKLDADRHRYSAVPI
ncbi:hypothetical protein HGRIS_001737 [Hohenbuehelia grisea]|uniref:DUF6593 domain-containing protein n=1 Tax=Hohenbuehelia grisea TaxID=104357 RepID=A0ABR3JJA9_9AGAR